MMLVVEAVVGIGNTLVIIARVEATVMMVNESDADDDNTVPAFPPPLRRRPGIVYPYRTIIQGVKTL